jgi:nitrogenase-stabilizing/protective protein
MTMTVISSSGTLACLETSSSAEDLFAALGVDYDPKVLDVARLHILKRMSEYLAGEMLDGLPDVVVTARCKAALLRAYENFERGSPLQNCALKVLKDAARRRPAFVPFDELLKSR